MECVTVEKQGTREIIKGLGIFSTFPRDDKQQIGWIPKEKVKDIELMLREFKKLNVTIESICTIDLIPK